MNKEMQIFDYDGMNIETIMWENHKGKVVPYFKAETVATVLGYTEKSKAYNLCKHTVKISKLDIEKLETSNLDVSNENNNLPTPYQSLVKQGLSHNEIIVKNIWINEFDIYRLVMRSKKPDAEKFQDWVHEEVLPKIRQDGMYIAGEEKVESGEMSIEEMTLKVHEYLQNKVNRLTLELGSAKEEIKQITDQYIVEGQTAADFCRSLNGVNIMAVQKWLCGCETPDKKDDPNSLQHGFLRKVGTGYKVNAYARDVYFTESTASHFGVTTYQARLTKKGAVWLFKKYLANKLPMKKDWNGEFVHDKMGKVTAKEFEQNIK